MGALTPAAAMLPAISTEILTSLHQHRLLTTAQVHQMHLPGRSRRWTERVLAQLAARELTTFVQPGARGPRLYFLTSTGAEAVEQIPTRAETRSKLITPEQAAGPLWKHTLAVNQAGIAFIQAARERGDDFGPFGWRHEIAHVFSTPGRGRTETLIADALLTYPEQAASGALTYHYRLIELDRATVPTDILASKLARYADLHAAAGQSEPAWRSSYPVFPDILCVLAGKPRAALQRRARTVLALCQANPRLQAAPEVKVSLALLDDLQAHGPYAAIWRELGSPSRPLNWLGNQQQEAK
jgi:hypothetical protein